uniref:Guanine nucleotide-binding protein subunit gamma n=1 Tax=Meleagris gallopavo TaxID=9103 RepID=A0A803YIV5_MELGA
MGKCFSEQFPAVLTSAGKLGSYQDECSEAELAGREWGSSKTANKCTHQARFTDAFPGVVRLGMAQNEKPTRVSQAAAELQQYCIQNACKDALLVGVPAGSNPFREPRSCTLL